MSRRRVSKVEVDSAREKLYKSSTKRVEGLKKGLDAQIIPDLIFASERTLAGWLAQGIGMWHTGMGLMNFGNRTADWCGYILAPIGMYFCVYAFYLYAIRLKLLKNGKPLPYDTSRMPIGIFVFFLLLSMILTIGFSITEGASERVEVVEAKEEGATSNQSGSPGPVASPTPIPTPVTAPTPTPAVTTPTPTATTALPTPTPTPTPVVAPTP